MEINQWLADVYYDEFGTHIWSRESDGDNHLIAEIRGWGRIQQIFKTHKECAEFQDEVGKFIAEAINEKVKRELAKKENLYTEEQSIQFAKWLAENWFPMWVKDKFVWEHDWDKTCEEQKYKGYYNEKELFNLFLSLKQPKQ
jgi:hypothetical protein